MKHRFKKVLQRFVDKHIRGRIPTSVSDNQTYPRLCLQASNDDRIFKSFRRNPIYNEILEHVPEEQGGKYLEIIARDLKILGAMDRFRKNDDFGDPKTYEYPTVGRISPTTLRYVKVLADLKLQFGSLDSLDICEIGVGYGGQCRIINAYFTPASYCLIDIGPALALARRFLGNYALPSALSYKTMNELAERQYDLVISNYAFTELRRSIQDEYLTKVIRRSKRGYITYNEISPVEFNSYKAAELLAIIPKSRIMKEEPLTHPKNCVIVWGSQEGS